MNNLQKIGVLAGLAVVAVTSVYYLTPKGYEGKCAEAIAPIKTKFKTECEAMHDGALYSGTLDTILGERDDTLSAVKCDLGAEKWYCGRGNYCGPQAEYEMRVENIRTCK